MIQSWKKKGMLFTNEKKMTPERHVLTSNDVKNSMSKQWHYGALTIFQPEPARA